MALTDDERYLFNLRRQCLTSIAEEGTRARLMKMPFFRHLSDALYDGRLEERIDFIRRAYAKVAVGWIAGELATLVERAGAFSDEVEYDDEVPED